MGVVLSVESLTVSITGTAEETVSTNLTNSQDETNCVPYYSVRATNSIRGNFHNRCVEVYFDNNLGTPRVNVHRFNPDFIEGDLSIEIFVVEFDPAKVNVEQGTFTIASGNSTDTSTVTTVTESKAACLTSFTPETPTFDYEDAICRTRFSTSSQLTHERSGTATDLTGRFFVIECIGTEFSTQFVQPSLGSTATSTTSTITAVTLSKAFLWGAGETPALNVIRDGACRWDFGSTTTVRLARDHGGTTASVFDADIWVIECANSEWDVQEFDVDISASTTTNQTITSVDTALTAICHQTSLGRSDPVADLGAPGNSSGSTRIQLTSDTNAQLTRQSFTGSGLATSFSAIEFELSVTATNVIPGSVRY